MRNLIPLAGVAVFLAGGLLSSVLPIHDGMCRIEVETDSGDVYIAGRGDTVLDAWRGSVIPADWASIRTVNCRR